MTFDQKHRQQHAPGPSPPSEGSQGSKHVHRPNASDAITKLKEALEQGGGEPTAYCIECHKRCEDCAVGCINGHEWR